MCESMCVVRIQLLLLYTFRVCFETATQDYIQNQSTDSELKNAVKRIGHTFGHKSNNI